MFEYILFYGGILPCYVGGKFGGLVTYVCKIYLCTARKLVRGAQNEGGGTFGNSNVPPRGFCQVWLNAYLSLRINMQSPSLTTMDGL